jgi:hypothetical protein
MESNPQIGALGGYGIAECEITPPHWFENHKHYYPVGPLCESNGEVFNAFGHVYEQEQYTGRAQ